MSAALSFGLLFFEKKVQGFSKGRLEVQKPKMPLPRSPMPSEDRRQSRFLVSVATFSVPSVGDLGDGQKH